MGKFVTIIFTGFCAVMYWIFGEWNQLTNILVFLMGIDLITAWILSAMKKSVKTENGGLNSEIGYKGLIHKFLILVVVAVSHQIDIVLTDSDYCRLAVTTGFILNETLSILENVGLMGVKLPAAVQRMIDALKADSESKDKDIKVEGGNENGKLDS